METVASIVARAAPAVFLPGVYFLVCDGEIAYVGMSGNPAGRIGRHAQRGLIPFDSYHVIECRSVEDARGLERAYIRTLRPPYNVAMVRLPRVTIAVKYPVERIKLLESIQERRGDEYLSQTFAFALDKLIEEYLPGSLGEAA